MTAMPRFRVAHVREQGVDLIVIPLDDAFERQTEQEQPDEISELQQRANAAGLAGTVVPVWTSHGRMKFIAPEIWHPLFRSLSFPRVRASLNKELRWP
jgi:hypothetical protein